MKKSLAFLACFALVLVSVSAFAGGIEQNTNQSAEFMKTMNRNASTDVDAVFFNPAATALMNDGLYLYFDYQCIIQPLSYEVSGIPAVAGGAYLNSKFDADKSAYYFGNIYLSWTKEMGPGSLALSLGFEPIGGGGSGTYEKPLFMAKLIGLQAAQGITTLETALNGAGGAFTTTNNQAVVTGMKLEGSSAYYAGQVNAAYSFKKYVALGVGYRYIYAHNTYSGTVDYLLAGLEDYSAFPGRPNMAPLNGAHRDKLDVTQTGMSHGVIGSVSVAPLAGMGVGDLNLAVKCEWHSKMELTNESKNTSLPVVGIVTNLANTAGMNDGVKTDHTLPMLLAFGASYGIKGVTVAASFNYYMNSMTKWGDDGDYDNNWEAGAGIDYTLPMIPLNIGLGYLYTYDSTPGSAIGDITEASNSHAAGVGLSYTFAEKFKLTLAYSFVYYLPIDLLDVNPTYAASAFGSMANAKYEVSKMSHAIALGFQAKLL